MAILRSSNFVNQQRIDTSHMRSIESAIRNDFDELGISLVTGENKSYVLRGLEINMTGAIGSSASGLQMIVANSSVFHGTSSEAGTFFNIASGTANMVLNSTTNKAVSGSFVPSTQNYIGLEFIRAVDDTTIGQVFLWNPVSKSEFSKTLPLALTLSSKIVISSSTWATNVLPIALVETDSANNVVSITDQRPMLFRLGTAGYITPNPFHSYPWNNQTEGRTENPYQSTTATSPFRGGDKQILNLKEWMDSIMTEFKALKGTPHWFDLLASISIENLYTDLANLQMTSRGRIFHSASVAGQINWDRDLNLRMIGSRLSFKINSNLSSSHVTLADNEVAYIHLNRQVDIIPNLIFTNAGAVVTSVGAVAWTNDVLAGDFIKPTYGGSDKYYEILTVDSLSQVTLKTVYAEVDTGSLGIQTQYTWGSYQTNATPSTNRHVYVVDRKDVPINGNVYWLFFRDDNSASKAKAYVRSAGGPGEIEQGESIEVSDTTADAVFDYMGSGGESDSDPAYAGAVDVKEVTTIEFPAQSDLAAGQYFAIHSGNGDKFAIYDTFNGVGTAPSLPGYTNVAVDLSATGDTENQVATKHQVVINALADFNATVLNNVVNISDQNNGTPTDAFNGTMGGAFYIKIPTEGDISTKFNQQNYNTVEGENLTRRAARLTAMVADKAQDKTIQYLPDFKICIKSTNGANQELLFANSDESGNTTTPYLNIGIPSSTNNCIITLNNGPLSLAVNQVAYVLIDRNAASSFDLSTITVGNIATCPLNENLFVVAYRLTDNTVWLWDGYELIDGNNTSLTAFNQMLEEAVYEEPIAIIAGIPATDRELQGPIAPNTVITLPLDTRNGNVAQGYVVGKGVLVIELNGIALKLGDDWQEVGSIGSASLTFETLITLEIGDVLNLRMDSFGGYVGVGAFSVGEANEGSNLGTGSQIYAGKSGIYLQLRSLKQGPGVALTQTATEIQIAASGSPSKPHYDVLADYVVLDNDGYEILLVTTGASNLTITLPTAADNMGRQIVVKKVDAGIGYVQIRAELTQYIDGQQGATYASNVNEIQNIFGAFTYYCDGNQFFVI
jgi:hypothetical protein